MDEAQQKRHRVPKAGGKAEKKKAKKQAQRNPTTVESARARNPKVTGSPDDRGFIDAVGRGKAFAYQSVDKAIRKERKQLDNDLRRTNVPLKERAATPSSLTTDKTPPVIISVVGPPGVGKTTCKPLLPPSSRLYTD